MDITKFLRDEVAALQKMIDRAEAEADDEQIIPVTEKSSKLSILGFAKENLEFITEEIERCV